MAYSLSQISVLKKIYNFDNLENILLNDLSLGNLHHAIIINSPKSSGKFSFIKQFLIKLQKKDFDSNLNILNINKADKSVITVDKIKKINNFLKLSAVSNEPRFIIIDTIDDLNINSANALLKNVEEPPQDVYFILISNNLENISATIKSRCRLFLVKNINFTDFCHIFTENNLSLNDNDLEVLFDISSGCIGQALLCIKHNICEIYNHIYSISKLKDIDLKLIDKISQDLPWDIFCKIIILIINKHVKFIIKLSNNLDFAFIIKDKINILLNNSDRLHLNKNHVIINILNLIIKLKTL